MTYRELTRKLRRLGCALDRQAGGSHEIWINPANNKETTIPRHGNRDLAVGTVHVIRRDLDISRREFGSAQKDEPCQTVKYTAIVECCKETGLLVGYVPGFPGAHAQGESQDDLNEHLEDVITMLIGDGAGPSIASEFAGAQQIQNS